MYVLLILALISPPANALLEPTNNPDGNGDASIINSQVALLEKKLANLESKVSDDARANTVQFAVIQSQLNIVRSDLAASQSEVASLKSQLESTKSELKNVKTQMKSTISNQTTFRDVLTTAVNEVGVLSSNVSDVSERCSTCELSQALSGLINSTRDELQRLKLEVYTTSPQLNSSTQHDVGVLKGQLTSAQDQISQTAAGLKSFSSNLSSLSSEMVSVKSEVHKYESSMVAAIVTIQSNVRSLNKSVVNLGNISTSNIKSITMLNDGSRSTYIHWGKKTCSSGSVLVYTGYAGGNNYFEGAPNLYNKGGPANTLCLPKEPIYVKSSAEKDDAGVIYGAEYSDGRTSPNFKRLQAHDVPCAVCQTRRESNIIMIPARNECYPGWKVKYWGYLMSGGYGQTASEYICVDHEAEPDDGGYKSNNGRRLYLVESRCGSLPCPPYINYLELTCVVCSR